MPNNQRDLSIDEILEENRPYYNERLFGEAVKPILSKAVEAGENVVGVFRGSLNRGWVNDRLGLPTNITWLIATDRHVIFMTFSLTGWNKLTIRYEDISHVDEKSHWPLGSLEQYLPKYVQNTVLYVGSPERKELTIVRLGTRISHLRQAEDDGHDSIASRIIRREMGLSRRRR